MSETKKVRLIGIDPLASFYNQINQRFEKEHNLKFKISPVEFGFFELLSYQYGSEYSDYILIDNALDHCIDPFAAIIECLRVLKTGGTLVTRHHVDEAYKAFYSGLHQWNICCDQNGDFIIWNRNNYVNVTQELEDYAEIKVEKETISSGVVPFGIVACNLTKKKELPSMYLAEERQRAGAFMKGFAEKLSDLQFAMKYLEIME